MKRTVDMLIGEHPLVANLASFALVALILALLAVGAMGLSGSSPDPDHLMSTVIGLLLGATLVMSLVVMASATFFVIKKRHEIIDWGSFLAITWLLPYIGISVYLGGSNLMRVLKKHRLHSA
jgi:hypothetical protein